jgi:hypothetical protein
LGSSFFSPDPQHIGIIRDILCAQSKPNPDFLASGIFRIMSIKNAPPQHPMSSFWVFSLSAAIFVFPPFPGESSPAKLLSFAHKTGMAEKRLRLH